jgi:uncharacterized protein
MVKELAAAVLLVSLAAPAALAADASEGGTEIHLSERATRTIAPDRLRAVLRAEVRGTSGQQVQAEINRRMEAALARAKSVSAVTAETGGYSVYRGSDPKEREPWHASQTLSLSAADFVALLSLAGTLQDMGLVMSGMQFFLAPETLKSTESELTAAALAALKARAAEAAKDLGATVERYKTITIGNASAPGPVAREFFAAQAAAAPAPPPVAQASEATVSLSADAAIILAPPTP